jgi:hypothetical protein
MKELEKVANNKHPKLKLGAGLKLFDQGWSNRHT